MSLVPLARLRLPAVLLALLAVAGCDGFNSDEQVAFELVATAGRSDGVTPDDWQVAPAFRGRVEITAVPSPNPARPGETVSLIVYASEAPSGLDLYRRREVDGLLERFQSRAGVSGPNQYPFSFAGGEVSTTGRTGTHRLLVLDGLERVVTYGDVVLE